MKNKLRVLLTPRSPLSTKPIRVSMNSGEQEDGKHKAVFMLVIDKIGALNPSHLATGSSIIQYFPLM